MISIQEFILGLGFSQPTTHKHVSIQIYTKFHTFCSSFLLLFSSSSLSLPLLLLLPFSSLFYVFCLSKMRDQLLLSHFFVKAMFGLCIFKLFSHFFHLGPSILPNFYSIFSQISYLHITYCFIPFMSSSGKRPLYPCLSHL